MEETRSDDRWLVVSRWLEYEGELRAALLRIVLVAAFYGAQLLHFAAFSERSDADQVFHRQATFVAAGWLFVSLAVLVALTRHWLASWLKFVTVAIDLVLLTLLAALGSGAASPLVFVYWVLVAMAGLRCNLPLIWFGTLGAMLAYLVLVGMRDPVWFDANHATPPIEQMVVHLSLAAAGLIVGQLVRMVRQVTEEVFARQLPSPSSSQAPSQSLSKGDAS
ncbi:MAG: hypothetical protein SFV81_15735 [Pirellulaceae bacterium]|nr:hypothetical protein [Pirellulaceae bacterium]